MLLYKQKRGIYFTQIREDLIAHIPYNPSNRILEIGAGGCATLVAIKERQLATEVAAVELFDLPHTDQSNPLIDRLFIGNIEHELPDYPLNYYDVILCGDVLEHLVDPWRVVKQITRFLKTGGIIIVSCPNIREVFTLSKILITGSFAYQESGIMDKTHLRFFCKKDLVELMTTDELVPVKAIPNYFITPRRGNFSRFHFGILDAFMAPQNIVVSQKR
ncbi:class I SAM-dependent methyltransferase [Arsenicibacter rosenii]|uniref:Methyltransferase type 11 n=1 Tax=Arsenicibacter rosenii TaxID=1750698 RepID=A0A1S2VE96_9BACT|nr:class I SAM-dependent methyltransferase [Arsenicibacter rosenii]OIN56516.1 hypothetical protein BLX24_24685 [Arsenicibacter rosenii]